MYSDVESFEYYRNILAKTNNFSKSKFKMIMPYELEVILNMYWKTFKLSFPKDKLKKS